MPNRVNAARSCDRQAPGFADKEEILCISRYAPDMVRRAAASLTMVAFRLLAGLVDFVGSARG